MVLYNNVLQSLFRSQTLTLGAVFLAVMLMLLTLFKSAKIAALAVVPNIVVSAMVLGLIGWLAIPLDIMTIAIAAIALGIAVDDTIHYTHRYLVELAKDGEHQRYVHCVTRLAVAHSVAHTHEESQNALQPPWRP